jgi:hypothetical protein
MWSIFLAFWNRPEIVPQAAAQSPLFHSVVILEKNWEHKDRDWSVNANIENGWSRPQLEQQTGKRAEVLGPST